MTTELTLQGQQPFIIVLIALAMGASIAISPLLTGVSLAMLIFTALLLFNIQTGVLIAIAFTPMWNICVLHLNIFDLRISQLMWGLIFIAIILQKMINRSEIKLTNKLTKPLILLIAASFLSILVSNYPIISLRESLQLLYFALVFSMTIGTLNEQRLIKKAVTMLLISGAIFIAFGVYQGITGVAPFPQIEINQLGNINFVQQGVWEQYTGSGYFIKRANSFFLSCPATAALSIAILMIVMSLIMADQLEFKKKIALYILFTFGTLLLFMTYSRAGYIIFPFSLLLLGWQKKRNTLIIITITGLVVGVLCLTPAVSSRLQDMFSIKESSNQGHLTLWLQAIIMFLNKPLFGYGAGTFRIESTNISLFHVFYRSMNVMAPQTRSLYLTTAPDAHNMILQTFAETGIVGGAGLLWVLYATLKNMWTAIPRAKRYYGDIFIGLFVAVIAFILINLTLNAMQIEFFWVLLAMGYSAANILNNKPKPIEI